MSGRREGLMGRGESLGLRMRRPELRLWMDPPLPGPRPWSKPLAVSDLPSSLRLCCRGATVQITQHSSTVGDEEGRKCALTCVCSLILRPMFPVSGRSSCQPELHVSYNTWLQFKSWFALRVLLCHQVIILIPCACYLFRFNNLGSVLRGVTNSPGDGGVSQDVQY